MLAIISYMVGRTTQNANTTKKMKSNNNGLEQNNTRAGAA
jgi:hypothetical protein